MSTTIQIKRSSTASAIPVTGDIAVGELAVNLADKRLYTKQSDGTIIELSTNPTDLDAATLRIDGVEITASSAELNSLDGFTGSTTELNLLDGLTATTIELNTLDGITASTAELNKLDGYTGSTAELNILDGVTATTAEINTLDGFTGTVADLNYAKDLRATGVTTAEFDKLDGLTATTTELNYTDGVTSNIQTQLNAMVEKSGDTMTGDLSLGDSVKAKFGAGDDLQIYHDGSDSYIKDFGTGNLNIIANEFALYEGNGTDLMMSAIPNGEVGLYHDNSKKLATTSTGVDVTGTVTADGLTVDNSSSTPVTVNRDQAIDGYGLILNQADTTDGNGLEISYQTTTTGTVTPNTPLAGIDFTADNHSWSTREGSIQLKTAKGGVGYKTRLNIAGNGDVSFYEDTGTTAKMVWDASAESLTLDGSFYIDHPNNQNTFRVDNYGTSGTDAGALLRLYDADGNNNIAFDARQGSTRHCYILGSNVGIGTASPSKNLHVYDSSVNFPLLVESGDETAGIEFKDNSTTQSPSVGANGNSLVLATAFTERMRIDSAGKVGIGTSAPSAKLAIETGGDEGIRLFRTSANANFGAIEFRNSTDTATNSRIGWNNNELRLEATSVISATTNGSERMRIDSAGNVGIGTASPSSALDVVGDINATGGANVGSLAASTASGVTATSGGGTARMIGAAAGAYFGSATNTPVVFQVNQSEKARIDSSGNLLVGGTTYEGSVTSNASSSYLAATGFISANVTNDFGMQVNRTGTDGKLFNFRKDGLDVGSIGSRTGASGITLNSQGADGILQNAGGDSFAWNANYFYPRTDNAKDLGFSSLRFKDLYLSGGVFLGGTGAANKLDDYEEGSWTPSYIGTTANPTVTYDSLRDGRYTKVGNLVIATFIIRTDSVSGGSGALNVSGLPFAVVSTTSYNAGTVSIAEIYGFGATPPLSGRPSQGNTVISLQYRNSITDTSESQVLVSALATGANSNTLAATITYYTTDS